MVVNTFQRILYSACKIREKATESSQGISAYPPQNVPVNTIILLWHLNTKQAVNKMLCSA